VVSDLKKWDVLRHPVRPVNLPAVSVPVGLSDVFGDRVTVISARALGCFQLILECIIDYRSGTFASGETVTIRHICVFHDGSEGYYDRAFTTTGSTNYTIGNVEFSRNMFRDSDKIPVAFVVQAKTNQPSTSVSVSVEGKGWMW
jgi:hypothetical protein